MEVSHQSIDFTDYDRITDRLMFLSAIITLNFTVTLAKKDKAGNRTHIHYEAEYSSKFRDQNVARSIKRDIIYYFTLDNSEDFGNGLVLRPQDVEILKLLLNQRILPWFFGTNRAFDIKDNKLYLKEFGEPVIYAQSDYKFVSFAPIVFEYEDGKFKEGIRIYLNNQASFADLDIDKFMQFVNIIKCTDMYNAALTMINYVKIPPYGINNHRSVGLGSGGDENRYKSVDRSSGGLGSRNGFLDSK